MAGRYSIDKIRADALLRASLDEVKSAGEVKQVRGRLDQFPTKRMVDAVNYLDKNILPAIKKKSGEQSPDYVFFSSVVEMLLWAVLVKDRFDRLETRWVNEKVMGELMRENLVTLQRELDKYTTIEDVWLTEGLDHYMKGVQAHAETLLNRKKS
jgi:hypothetical protein